MRDRGPTPPGGRAASRRRKLYRRRSTQASRRPRPAPARQRQHHRQWPAAGSALSTCQPPGGHHPATAAHQSTRHAERAGQGHRRRHQRPGRRDRPRHRARAAQGGREHQTNTARSRLPDPRCSRKGTQKVRTQGRPQGSSVHQEIRRVPMLKIRLRRTGAKKQPSYRLVVAEATSPRDGTFIENPRPLQPADRADHVRHQRGPGARMAAAWRTADRPRPAPAARAGRSARGAGAVTRPPQRPPATAD